ncbi:hypothetical protein E2F48_07870 [Arthrobacter crusticola]|uniref:DUF4362 domain-containing protein n=1 Tax=Arthrobacter crusticola TaxID=2547960 RepID=A0A4R5TVN9_9MICC|nr:hypothetical protein [Arthrobacter crusticola]TDK25195.1 hypothetical protein E2F48_07870 [Arthrobacter crusticola]
MKKSLSWRLLVLVAGMLLGLLAGLGLSAPAVAAPVQTVAATDYSKDKDKDNELTLKVDRDGKLKVIGKGYEANRVKVIIVQTNHKDREKEIYNERVWTDKGRFEVESKKAKCGNEYRAYSYSKKDGLDRSKILRIDCRKGGGH